MKFIRISAAALSAHIKYEKMPSSALSAGLRMRDVVYDMFKQLKSVKLPSGMPVYFTVLCTPEETFNKFVFAYATQADKDTMNTFVKTFIAHPGKKHAEVMKKAVNRQNDPECAARADRAVYTECACPISKRGEQR